MLTTTRYRLWIPLLIALQLLSFAAAMANPAPSPTEETPPTVTQKEPSCHTQKSVTTTTESESTGATAQHCMGKLCQCPTGGCAALLTVQPILGGIAHQPWCYSLLTTDQPYRAPDTPLRPPNS